MNIVIKFDNDYYFNFEMKNHRMRRDRERKELRFRILEAARALFEQGGEAAVTLRRVGETIEFSATTIYLHFSNKEALVREICATEFALFSRSLQQAESTADAMGRLRKIASLYVDFGLRHPEHYRVLFMREQTNEPGPTSPPVDPTLHPSTAATRIESAGTLPPQSEQPQPYDHLQRAIFKAMAAGCFKPEYRDIDLLAQSVWSCLHGVVTLHLVRAQCPGVPWKPVHGILEMSVEAFFNGITVPLHQTPPTWHR